MASNFLSTLPLSVRQAYPIIRSAVKEGLASRSIQTLLTKRGLGIRRQTLLDVMRLEREGFQSALTFRLLAPNVIPRQQDIPFAVSRLRRNYSYVFEVQTLFKNKVTTRMMTVSTNERLTLDESKERIVDALESNIDAYGEFEEIVSITPQSIVRAGAAGVI